MKRPTPEPITIVMARMIKKVRIQLVFFGSSGLGLGSGYEIKDATLRGSGLNVSGYMLVNSRSSPDRSLTP